MIIDAHAHIYPDNLAERVITKLTAYSGYEVHTDGTLKGTLEVYRNAGIDKFVSLNICNRPNQEDKVNAFALSTRCDGLISIAGVHPFSEKWEEALYYIKSAGFAGIKLHPEYQDYDALAPEVVAVYALCEKLGLVVVAHSGWDIAFPDSDKACPRKFRLVIDKFPDLKIVLAHFGGMMRWDAVWDYIAGSSAYVDTAMCARYFPRHFFEKIVTKHGTDRILFGSDCPWESPTRSLEFIKSFGLGKDDSDKIFYKNAEKLFLSGENK